MTGSECTFKMKRKIITLRPGIDLFLDNGACWQLLTQKQYSGPWSTSSIVLTQKALKLVKKLNLKKIKKHQYEGCDMWMYMGMEVEE